MNDLSANAADVIELTVEIVSAYVSNNALSAADLPSLIAQVHAALGGLGNPVPAAEEPAAPAVPVKRSVHSDHIVCLEDGKHFKSLKRHLQTHHDMTPEQYRTKWSLPSSYPMVAPDYAAQRSELAKNFGLGRKPAAVAPVKRKGGKARA